MHTAYLRWFLIQVSTKITSIVLSFINKGSPENITKSKKNPFRL